MRTLILDVQNEQNQKFVLEANEADPIPDKYDIVVQVKACALSSPNFKVLSDVYKKYPRSRYIVGYEVAGIVTQKGPEVSNVATGDSVVGIVSLGSHYSGCGEYCLLSEYDVVKKPERLSYEEAVAGIGDCLKAYTALYYHAHVCSGDTVLIIDGASSFGNVAIQLASQWGAKVISTASSNEERGILENLDTPIAQIIDLDQRSNILVSSVMEETGGVGVDVVIDNGVRQFNDEEDQKIVGENLKYPKPHKHDVISCLGASGKWITQQPGLQLDPPDCQKLFLRGGSVHFLFENIWTLAYSQHGRFQHILQDAVEKLERGIVKCKISKTISLDSAADTMKTLQDIRTGKVVVKI
ncbi:quinone oxidoreductase-like protein 1 [Saccostrea cucullata]|uniref:quinone oxidoreductase-like protein 1 n=1 Tax=Saccostrea cuccullata TaxID=36930 RepID=UPI002ED5177E